MRRLLLVLLLIATFVTPFARPEPAGASGQELYWDEDGATFATFGANESVTIAFGTILFECDFFFPTADVYVMQSIPAIGDTLTDVNGKQNTVFGATGGLFSDTIAVTKPSGTLGNGLYTVVYDECQDGKLDTVDAVFTNAFEVSLPSTLPPIDPAIGALKSHADQLANQMQTVLNILDLYEAYQELQEAIECIKSPGECAISMIVDEITGAIIDEIKEILGLMVDPKEAARDAAVDTISHWKGIAADPPDPAFQQHTLIERTSPIDPQTDDPLVVAEVALGNAHLNEAALARALLHALERYQGAVAADDGDWALVHARDIQTFSTLMAGQLAASSTAAGNLVNALDASTIDIDGLSSTLAPDRQRIVTSGFLPDEERLLLNLGMTQQNVDALRSRIARATGTVSETELISTLNDLIAANMAAIPDLHALATDMDAIIDGVLVDPATTGDFPIANAGGPYDGVEGEAITLIGSGSTSPGSIVAYDWDIDGDGAFDDASGPVVSQTFLEAFDGYVGLRITNAAGLTSTSYAALSVGSANGAPAIQGFTPTDAVPTIIAGATQPFAIDAADADGDAVSVVWRVDGADRGTGAAFVYGPSNADIGVHLIEAVVSDDSPLGGEVRQVWSTVVRHPDADADGWDANVDCDDTDAFVNFDAFEVPGNGRDDDCDPVTSDDLIDSDGDGFDQSVDCNDNDPNVHPAATELPNNGKDDDCDPSTPDGDASSIAGHTLVETIVVPVRGETIASSTTLANGVTYKLRASGTFTIGGPGLADAEYSFNSSFTQVIDACNGGPIDNIGIQLNGLQDGTGKLPKWGPFTTDHVYTIDFAGNGAPLSIRYVDCDLGSGGSFGDNSGSLTLEVWAPIANDPCASQTLRPAVGKIVVNHDEWPLTNYGFAVAPDAANFARNVACWFTGGVPGNFLVYSQNGGLTQSMLAQTMTDAGHSWTIGFVDFTLATLQQYDAIFLAGNPADTSVLIDYVQAGGNVYLAGGTGQSCDQTTWNSFLFAFGLAFGPCWNGITGVFPIASDHPILANVSGIYQDHGNTVLELDPADPRTEILTYHAGQGLYGVFNGSAGEGTPVEVEVEAGPDQTVDLGATVSLAPATFTGAATGSPYLAAIDWGDGITTAGFVTDASSSGSVDGTHIFASAGMYTVTVTVTDDDGISGSDSFRVTVNNRNRPPVIASIDDQTLSEGATLVVGVAASDPDGDAITLSAAGLPGYASFTDHGDGTGSLQLWPGFDAAGIPVNVTIEAFDGNSTTSTNASITVIDVDNREPLADAGPDQSVHETNVVALDGSGSSDADGDSLDYSWQVLQSIGPAVTLSIPTSAHPDVATTDNGVYVLRLTVRDGNGASDTDDVTVIVGNVAPVIAGVSNAGPVTPGQDVAITVDASDVAGDRDPLTMRFDCDGNGAFERTTGVCTFHQDGSYQVGVEVMDDDGGLSTGFTTVSVATNTQRYAIFAGRDDCGSANGNDSAIHWTGSTTTVTGDVHSNGGLMISGSRNGVNGVTSYRCDKHISGSEHSFTEGVTQVSDIQPWPIPLTIEDFTCDTSVAGTLDLSKDGEWWVGGTSASQQLLPQTLCADVIMLSGSNISGEVTLVAQKIHISGSKLQLTAHQHDVLAFSIGSAQTLKISSSNSHLTGDLVARDGNIDLSGASNTVSGSIAGWTVKLPGSSWTIGVP